MTKVQTTNFEKAKQLVLDTMKQHFGEEFYQEMLEGTRFYTPEEWKTRGEPYGEGSVLIFTFDCCLFDYFNYYWQLGEKLQSNLIKGQDWHYEMLYSWCLAVYPI